MLISRISTCAVFDPEAVKTLVAAFDDACAALNVTDRADPRAMTVAKKIIEHARRGERDPIRLREAVLTELQRDGDTGCPRSSSSQATPDDDDTNAAGERREERSCKELV
jgi:hypothetical protein